MRRTIQGVHQLAQALQDFASNQPLRAVDETGYVQPALKQLVAARGVHSFYHNNAIQSWQISAGGQVTNVHV